MSSATPVRLAAGVLDASHRSAVPGRRGGRPQRLPERCAHQHRHPPQGVQRRGPIDRAALRFPARAGEPRADDVRVAAYRGPGEPHVAASPQPRGARCAARGARRMGGDPLRVHGAIARSRGVDDCRVLHGQRGLRGSREAAGAGGARLLRLGSRPRSLPLLRHHRSAGRSIEDTQRGRQRGPHRLRVRRGRRGHHAARREDARHRRGALRRNPGLDAPPDEGGRGAVGVHRDAGDERPGAEDPLAPLLRGERVVASSTIRFRRATTRTTPSSTSTRSRCRGSGCS